MIVTATSTDLPGALPVGGIVRETDTGIFRQRVDETTWTEVARRFRLSRAAGARLPEGVTNVARPSKWGNPWKLEHLAGRELPWTVICRMWPVRAEFKTEDQARGFAVQRHRVALRNGSGLIRVSLEDVLRELVPSPRVACWCHFDELCHGDNYLEVIVEQAMFGG